MAAQSTSKSRENEDFGSDDCSDDEELIEFSPGIKGRAVKRLRDDIMLYHVVSGGRGRPKQVFLFPPRPKSVLLPIERQMIVRVFSNLNKLGEDDASKKTAFLLDFSEISVKRTISDFNQDEGLLNKRQRGNFTNHPTCISSSKELRESIYSLLVQRAAKGENTSAKKMLQILTEQNAFSGDSIPKYETFLSYLKRQKFVFGRDSRSKTASLDVSKSVKLKRAQYLDAIAKPPVPDMVDVYQDESYCHQNHCKETTWFLESDEKTKRAKRYKGQRFCFSACITRDGLLPNSLWMFCPNKSQQKKKDYHSSFNSTNFDSYFRKMLDAFEAAYPDRKATFHMDTAKYHTFLKDVPQLNSKKEILVEFCQTHIPEAGVTMEMLKTTMQGHIKEYIRQKGTTIEQLAKSRGHRVLFTPPKHSTWQPIESYWASVKNRVADQYVNGRSLETLKGQLEASLAHYGTAKHCSAYIRSAHDKIDEFRRLLDQIDEREDSGDPYDLDDDDEESDSESPWSDEE
jgi:hypothetical protein